ncbi:MAG TPA: DinB family protein [Bacteroidia bacterium]|nr:DinB family protein [Bacteroidia bacterium]
MNIALVVQHLINNNQPYFDIIRQKISKYKGQANNNREFKHSFWGKFLYKMVAPESINKKLKTPKPFRPDPDPDITTLAARFDANQEELLNVIEESRKVDAQKVLVRSPAAWIMRFHIADALAALSVHELRHLQQIRNIMNYPGFPKG